MRIAARLILPVLLLATVLVVPGSVAWAKPPASEGFVRIVKLKAYLDKRFEELKAAEEFESKPFPEKLLIKWSEGETSFESVRKLTGEAVLKAIFEWDELTSEPPTAASDRVAKMLPGVLKYKYGEAVQLNTAFKRDRYKAGRVLVDQLVKPPLHVRELAIECLKMTYNGVRRNYVAEDSKAKRSKRQKEWLEYVKRRAR